jgi:glycosyltransferase involved in cell wall biosynthesis
MSAAVQASIVITSYNYGGYLRAAVDSALAQTYANTQVVVVDDGSSDDSPDVIRSYGGRVTAIMKENGGQASAFNAGMRASTGDVVCFMDSDDLIYPEAVGEAVAAIRDGVCKVHWPLEIIDRDGRRTGQVMHKDDLAAGDVREQLIARGPAGYNWPSTSGNAWTRGFLERVMPMPEEVYRIGPDVYLSALAPLFGTIHRLEAPRGAYRVHGNNNTFREPFDTRVAAAVKFWDHCFGVLGEWCGRLGFPARSEEWKRHSFWHQARLAAGDVCDAVPSGEPVILIGEDQWATDEVAGRRIIPFLERDGCYWGAPADDEAAIVELERQRALGVRYALLPWWSFWWEEHYAAFWRYLHERFTPKLESERAKVFDLQHAGGGRTP